MEAGLPIDVLLPIVIALMMFAVGLGLRPADFRAVVTAPRAAAIGLAGMFIAFPALAFILAAAFRLEPALAIGLVLLAASPSASTSTIFTYAARGDVALSVALTAVSKIVPVVIVPVYVSLAALLFAGERIEVGLSFADTSEAIAITILLPTVLGMAVRQFVPDIEAMRRHVGRVAVLLLIVLIGVLAFRERAQLPQMFAACGPAALTLCVAGLLGGHIAASLGGLTEARRSAIAIEIAMQSGGTSIAIAAGVLGAPGMAVPAAVYSLVMYGVAGTYVAWARTAPGGVREAAAPATGDGAP